MTSSVVEFLVRRLSQSASPPTIVASLSDADCQAIMQQAMNRPVLPDVCHHLMRPTTRKTTKDIASTVEGATTTAASSWPAPPKEPYYGMIYL
ncbi:Aste57867_13922 [Aphanomyces stellatus]|uniref:Aste57867_13922 protein n=1 Tax=Aphanomyces stellatus TaxID=120398 RepID=A0A485KZY3_9STRA|nr:hypothetical protein As57867_013871 [Aphanomyces stellatus]VFT90752.1 Aste57867_13922 [Aphanomyces stellatus]